MNKKEISSKICHCSKTIELRIFLTSSVHVLIVIVSIHIDGFLGVLVLSRILQHAIESVLGNYSTCFTYIHIDVEFSHQYKIAFF